VSTLSYMSLLLCMYCFFFSSRIRHTRCYRDWSSDVCSSDLFVDDLHLFVDVQHIRHFGLEVRIPPLHIVSNLVRPQFALTQDFEIGRASCRVRMWLVVVMV